MLNDVHGHHHPDLHGGTAESIEMEKSEEAPASGSSGAHTEPTAAAIHAVENEWWAQQM